MPPPRVCNRSFQRSTGKPHCRRRDSSHVNYLDPQGKRVNPNFCPATVDSGRKGFLALGLELGDRGLDLGLLPLEMGELIVDLLSRQPQLRRPFAALGALEKALNLGKRKAELLALENELEPSPLGTVVEARGAGPLRLEEAAILVEAQGPQRDAEFPGEVADAVAAAPRLA